eukprot:COSAG05_NODE_11079_length_532_cov_0.847575_1_plen_73_part_01
MGCTRDGYCTFHRDCLRHGGVLETHSKSLSAGATIQVAVQTARNKEKYAVPRRLHHANCSTDHAFLPAQYTAQ